VDKTKPNVDFDCIYFVKTIPPMKYPLILIVLLTAFNAKAQFKLPGSSSFRSDFQKVVEDFAHGFSSIRGDVTVKNPQTIEYASKVTPSGMSESTVIEYSTEGKPVYSWQALVISTESFTEAEKKYKWLFNQVKGMNVTYVVDQYTLRGKYEAPKEEIKFATCELSLFDPPPPLRKMKVEVSMQFEFPEWKVSLLVYEKEKEDDEQASKMN
jgi:hypothetical protein